jgi:NADPH-dependent 2,4-dienoyl-CoA reductase/sulfur reductase-like enzyme
MSHIVIIGNGISGITAARHIRKRSDDRITVISGETDYFFSRTALMYVYMGHMKFEHIQPYENWFWEKNKIDLKKAWVKNINSSEKKLLFENGETLEFDKLILALGSKPNKFGWPGQDLKGVSGMYSAQDLEYIEEYTKDIKRGVVVGGGLIGIELAEMMHSRGIEVTFLVREPSFWNIVLPPEESSMINQEILDQNVDLRLSSELKEIVADTDGRVEAIITGAGERIECQFVGLTAGVSPNIGLLAESGIDTNRGILVDENLETNVKGIYAIGDCAEFKTPLPNRKPIEQVWYTGRMHGETVAKSVTGDVTTYNPGLWFNSAKFFDIEYQTYGTVLGELQEGEAQFYWEHSSGKKCVKIVYDAATLVVKGMNVFGLRMRHEVWDKWLNEKQELKYVIAHLREANFDPELYIKHEKEIQSQFSESEMITA